MKKGASVIPTQKQPDKNWNTLNIQSAIAPVLLLLHAYIVYNL